MTRLSSPNRYVTHPLIKFTFLCLYCYIDLNISPPENAEQDRDGCDQREQRGDAGGQGPHLEESLF